jgi:hypothetical protein
LVTETEPLSVQEWIDWQDDTPAQLQGQSRLVFGVYEEDREWTWYPEYLGVFSVAQPPSRRPVFIQLGFDLLVFPSGWFMLALEDYPQASWALQVLERNWIQAEEWRLRFLRRPLRHIEPRFLCLVFGDAGYPLYITLNARRTDSHGTPSRYMIEFLDSADNEANTVDSKVRSQLRVFPSRANKGFAGGTMQRMREARATQVHAR